jgi:hypothetical protein
LKRRLNMTKIAAGLGATRQGRIAPGSGHFGAMQVLAEVEARFRVPGRGGRATDPAWTEWRLVPLAPRTLARLERVASKLREHGGVNVEPMQLAALLLERDVARLSERAAEELVRAGARAKG